MQTDASVRSTPPPRRRAPEKAASPQGLSRAVIEACLDRLAASPELARSHRLVRFLRYTVASVLEGRGDELKERTVAMEVYGRPADYDPRCDPIVRTEAHRLRAKLRSYYQGAGRLEPLVIELPKGSYLPRFRAQRGRVGGSGERPRLMVGRFGTRGEHEEDQPFARAMTEALTARLAGQPGLEVVRRRTGLRGELEAPTEGLDYALEGDIERSPEGMQVRTRLVRCTDAAELWSDVREVTWELALTAQVEIAEAVARALGAPAPAQPEPTSSVDPTAYELLAKGRHSLVQYANTHYDAYFEAAERRLHAALERQPDLVDALAELGFLYTLALYPPRPDAAELRAEARSLLERALALDPRHVRSLCVLAEVEGAEGLAEEALVRAETAVALDPADAEARTLLALRLAAPGFWESAVASCDVALSLDPLWDVPVHVKLRLLGQLGRFEAAQRTLEALRRERPGSTMLELDEGELRIARGDAAGAFAILSEGIERLPSYADRSALEIARGLAAAMRGDARTARAVLAAFRDSPPRLRDHLVRLALRLDQPELALERLRRDPHNRSYRWLQSVPEVRPWLARPDWKALAEELHASWRLHRERFGPRLPERPPTLPPPRALRTGASAA